MGSAALIRRFHRWNPSERHPSVAFTIRPDLPSATMARSGSRRSRARRTPASKPRDARVRRLAAHRPRWFCGSPPVAALGFGASASALHAASRRTVRRFAGIFQTFRSGRSFAGPAQQLRHARDRDVGLTSTSRDPWKPWRYSRPPNSGISKRLSPPRGSRRGSRLLSPTELGDLEAAVARRCLGRLGGCWVWRLPARSVVRCSVSEHLRSRWRFVRFAIASCV
jgi:hypothetical protein